MPATNATREPSFFAMKRLKNLSQKHHKKAETLFK